MSAADIVLAHGYTVADIHQIARLAVHSAWGSMATPWHERYELAHGAVAEALLTASSSPLRRDLVRAGQRAIQDHISDERHHHGYYKHKTIGAAAGPGSSPAYVTYWAEFNHTTGGPEHAVVERLALYQILCLLTDRQREALAALAVLGDYRAAAAALGVKPQTYRALLGRARKDFFALWHEGETPSRCWGTDRRVRSYALRDAGDAA